MPSFARILPIRARLIRNPQRADRLGSAVLPVTPSELDGTGDSSTSLVVAVLAIGIPSLLSDSGTSLIGSALASGVAAGTGSASTSLVGSALDVTALAASGVSSSSLIGSALGAGVASGTGSAATSLIGAALAAGVVAATGIASTSLIGAALDATALAATGSASTSLVGSALDAAALAAAGSASSALVGSALDAAALSASGASSSSLIGAALDAGLANGAGNSISALVGSALASGLLTGIGSSVATFVDTEIESAIYGMFAASDTALDALALITAAFTAAGDSAAVINTGAPPVIIPVLPAMSAGGGIGKLATGRYARAIFTLADLQREEDELYGRVRRMDVEAEATFTGSSAVSFGGASTASGSIFVIRESNINYAARTVAAGSFNEESKSVSEFNCGVLVGVTVTSESTSRMDATAIEDIDLSEALRRLTKSYGVRVDVMPEPVVQPIPVVINDAVDPEAAVRTVKHALMLRRVGLKLRKGRIPRQHFPKSLEMEYAKAMIGHIDSARSALTPLEHELGGLLERAREARGDRMDAGESERARNLIAKARQALEQVTRPTELESLAQLFGKRTQAFNRVQLGRQVKAALGADVFASDLRLQTLLDHFVSENVVLIKSIPTQVIDQIEGIVTRGFTAGQMHKDIAEEIDDRFDVGESRARLIARDQIGKLYGQTNAYRQQDLGISSFIWRTSEDERVRPEHEELNGQEFSYDDPPDEGLPGEPIQCRCGAEPVFASIKALSEDLEEAA